MKHPDLSARSASSSETEEERAGSQTQGHMRQEREWEMRVTRSAVCSMLDLFTLSRILDVSFSCKGK